MSCEQQSPVTSSEHNEKPSCPFTTKGVYVSFSLRFIHMLCHIPLGFADFGWAVKLHDVTGDVWEEYESTGAGSGRAPTVQTIGRLFKAARRRAG